MAVHVAVEDRAAKEEKALRQLTDRLAGTYGDTHSADCVEAMVDAARQRFDGHRIRDFIPILVERIVRRELEQPPVKNNSPQPQPDLRLPLKETDSDAPTFIPADRKRIVWIAAAVMTVVLASVVALVVRQPDSEPIAAAPMSLTTVRGVVGSEKMSFFEDPRVIDALAKHGLKIEVEPAGSRQISTTVDLAEYDFAFPSSAAAAERIQRAGNITAKYTPFSSPMAIATFRPIADLLTQAGIVKPTTPPTFDMEAYLALAEKGTQWDALPGNTTYPVRKNILVATTDPRTSNSAAMYLSVAAYVANDNTIVRGRTAEDHAVSRVSRLFTRQGYTESSSDAPFKDYLANGMGPTPLVWIYESQYMAAAIANQIKSDMVLLYPSPTVLSQHTVVPLDDSGDRLGKLLTTDPDLQRLAAEHGFRPADQSLFTTVAAQHQIPVTPTLIDIVDPPTYDTLEHLLDGVAASYN
ncbi:three-helix bundle dimerization domain-containing protein [Nocardia acididurans]|uniref:three-helix bundle dimerization domain-containing protein n=1 Tax=Nocardia acididurans TaxID=2802282 RepID=UPI0027DD5F77|nr:hypothetical protein [Nocardia acididurans]